MTLINWLVLINDMCCVLCEVRTEFSYTNFMNVSLEPNDDNNNDALQVCNRVCSWKNSFVFCLSQAVTAVWVHAVSSVWFCHFNTNEAENWSHQSNPTARDLQIYTQQTTDCSETSCIMYMPAKCAVLCSAVGYCVTYSCHLHVHFSNRWQSKILRHSVR
jgi:hypothetical protein